jgi:hypothetical protein
MKTVFILVAPGSKGDGCPKGSTDRPNGVGNFDFNNDLGRTRNELLQSYFQKDIRRPGLN